jgi:fructokinase
MARFAMQRLALTRGPEGWAWYGPDGVLEAEGAGVPQPQLVDTVGAGDSFTAMLLAGQALGRRMPDVLALANRYAAFICGIRGPLPAEAAALLPWQQALAALPAT